MTDRAEVKKEPAEDGTSPAPQGNGHASSSTSSPAHNGVSNGGGGDRTADYDKLIQYGLDSKVASRIDDIYKTGKKSSCNLH